MGFCKTDDDGGGSRYDGDIKPSDYAELSAKLADADKILNNDLGRKQ